MRFSFSIFTTARIKLTLLYLIIILTITGSISFIFYRRTTSVIQTEFKKIEQRIQVDSSRGPSPRLRLRLLQDNYESTKAIILWQLIQVNMGVAGIFLVVSFYFSGKTLKPIEEALERQRRFVADAAHELRTPIAAIKTNLEVSEMNKKHSPDLKREIAENLEDIANLEVLTESLLKLARLEESQLKLTEVDLVKSIDRSIKQLQPQIKKQKVKVIFNNDDNDYRVKGDEGLVTELLVIFLDNAVKYSPSGREVRIEVLESRTSIKIFIEDQGCGVSAQDLPHLFERFYRVDQARCKVEADGYGLGLSIAKRISEVLHGKVQMKSTVGQGTTAIISLQKA